MGRSDAEDRVWRFQRAVARVEVTVDEIVADHATCHVGRPVRRRWVRPPRPLPGIAWSIDGSLVVEFVHRREARDQVVVHDIAILHALKKRLRSRHVDVTYVMTTWGAR